MAANLRKHTLMVIRPPFCIFAVQPIDTIMKKLLAALIILFAAGPVVHAQNNAKSSYGAKIDEHNFVDASRLPVLLAGKDSLAVKVRGKVLDVCQRKGCWMNISLGNGQEMKVRFKDYGFFVPKNAMGKIVVMDGVAYREKTSVEELRHYAEDAGKSKEEIEKINQPEENISYEASGVLIYNE